MAHNRQPRRERNSVGVHVFFKGVRLMLAEISNSMADFDVQRTIRRMEDAIAKLILLKISLEGLPDVAHNIAGLDTLLSELRSMHQFLHQDIDLDDRNRENVLRFRCSFASLDGPRRPTSLFLESKSSSSKICTFLGRKLLSC